jgi:glycosyltransferase involved in cell wall biosynthesis
MSLRILQVITDTDRRGAQVFAGDLQAAFAKQGHVVVTVALAPGRVGGLDVPVLGPSRRSVSTFRELRWRSRGFDVVVAHGSTTLPMCAIAGVGTRRPFVYRQISDLRFWAGSRARRLRVRLALSRAAGVAALWSGSADLLVKQFGVSRERVAVIPNGVPAERFPPVDDARRAAARARLGLVPGSAIAAYVGALVPEKGLDLAIEAVGGLPEVLLLVAGDGPERGGLEALATACAPDRVRFVGQVDSTADVYAAADVVVLPSRGGDSMPATLIEAGLTGIPAVSTRVEAIPDVVVDGATGILVPIGSVDELREAIAALVRGEQGRRMGSQAHAHCLARFSIDAVAASWSEFLGAVVGGPRT